MKENDITDGSMSVIDENVAWRILLEYVQDCLRIDTPSLVAVFASGSLPAGYFRPGQSDIDAVLIVRDGSEAIWGDGIRPSELLEELSRRYLETYRIPKDFGPFPIQVSALWPPYAPEQELVPEIARLKLQGRCIFGSFDLDRVPMPTVDDFLQYAQHFEQWVRDEFIPHTPLDTLSTTACVNTVLMHLRRFLVVERGVIELDKRKAVQACLENGPPFVDAEMLRLVQSSLALQELPDADGKRLRECAGTLRLQMNAYLGISV